MLELIRCSNPHSAVTVTLFQGRQRKVGKKEDQEENVLFCFKIVLLKTLSRVHHTLNCDIEWCVVV